MANLLRQRTPDGRNATQATDGPESGLHDAVVDECKRRGWLAFHGSMARRTSRVEGEPDFIILADIGRTYLVECKSATGKLSPKQQAVRAHAARLGHLVHVVRSFAEFLRVIDV